MCQWNNQVKYILLQGLAFLVKHPWVNICFFSLITVFFQCSHLFSFSKQQDTHFAALLKLLVSLFSSFKSIKTSLTVGWMYLVCVKECTHFFFSFHIVLFISKFFFSSYFLFISCTIKEILFLIVGTKSHFYIPSEHNWCCFLELIFSFWEK